MNLHLRSTVVKLAITLPVCFNVAFCQEPDAPTTQPRRPTASRESVPTTAPAAKSATEPTAGYRFEPVEELIEDNDDQPRFENQESPELDEVQTIKISQDWKRLGKNQIWINHSQKQVMVRGRICLRKGPLEMFACPGISKAHESVVATEAKASEIHACFVALGFGPGHPVQWEPQYKTATGPSIAVILKWQQDGFLKEADAKTMVRIAATNKTLDTDWVFGGSQEFTDNVTGEKIYYADSGEMICLSNFSTAMMDVPIQSSDSAQGLLFEANTPNVPPVNTKVYMVLKPRKSQPPK